VITGIGLVSPLGISTPASWEALLSNQTNFSAHAKTTTVIARAPKSMLETSLAKLSKAHEPRFISMALAASTEALADANLPSQSNHHNNNVACIIGCGMGAATHEVALAAHELNTRGINKISPFMVPRLLPNMAAGLVSIHHKLQGPNGCPSTACASGCNAVGDAFRLLQRGDADVAVCGGTESALDDVSLAGFSRLRALSTRFVEAPATASRPFDVDRDGFVMGEGAAVLVLETLDHFLHRESKKPAYAEIVGYGSSGDAYHVTSPSPEGGGAERCMRRALADAHLTSVDYCNAHATSTPLGDQIEAAVLARVHQSSDDKAPLLVSSTKGSTGHLLGAAGAVEIAFTALALFHRVVPHTNNLRKLQPGLDGNGLLDFVQTQPRQTPFALQTAMSNSFGFGGVNASIVLKVVQQ
jgi:3-oxoacyl-[acyl-carrier-protein] synthase II